MSERVSAPTGPVLIANLGDSPVVIAALVRTLAASGKPVSRLEVLYPGASDERWIGKGFAMLKDQLDAELPEPVEGVVLPFADAATSDDCLRYLRQLCNRLEHHERAGIDVILGISGGRKHTSALMAVPACFYRCVTTVIHLHDYEGEREGSQLVAHQLAALNTEQRALDFRPPATRFSLVNIPHMRMADGPTLRRWLAGREQGKAIPPITITPRARAFYGAIFGLEVRPELDDAAEPARPLELIAPLGESPMVITQACALLARQGHQVAGLHIIYPHNNGPIYAGAQLLKKVCQLRKLRLELIRVPIRDLNGPETIEPFQAGLRSAIDTARTAYPTHEPVLLLSGGRKGMAALALSVAQGASISRVYHTTIPSPEREAEIVREYAQAEKGSYPLLAQLMFLENIDHRYFELIEVPVIAMNRSALAPAG